MIASPNKLANILAKRVLPLLNNQNDPYPPQGGHKAS
jgi:hypothetical protein